MLDLITLLDTPGAKGFFQSPSYLLGVPLLLLGILGVLAVLTPIELRWPEPQTAAVHGAEGHPTPLVYIQVGIILGIITGLEVAVYYVDIARGALLGILLVLSAMKFVLVILWFMHLRFDSRLFTMLFAGGLLLVLSLFAVVLTSLGASLT